MNGEVVGTFILCLFLWLGTLWMRSLSEAHLSRERRKQKDRAYHHLVEFGGLLASDVHLARMVTGGRQEFSRKRAEKLSEASAADAEMWKQRLALTLVIDHIDRLGQAVEMGVFDIDLVWQTNGEAILGFHYLTRHVVDALNTATTGFFPRYLSLIEQLKQCSAMAQVERDEYRDLPVGVGMG